MPKIQKMQKGEQWNLSPIVAFEPPFLFFWSWQNVCGRQGSVCYPLFSGMETEAQRGRPDEGGGISSWAHHIPPFILESMVRGGPRIAVSCHFVAIDSFKNLMKTADPPPPAHVIQTLTCNVIWFLYHWKPRPVHAPGHGVAWFCGLDMSLNFSELHFPIHSMDQHSLSPKSCEWPFIKLFGKLSFI